MNKDNAMYQELNVGTLPASIKQDIDKTAIRSIYFSLLDAETGKDAMERAGNFLRAKLKETQDLDCDLPDDMRMLSSWIDANTESVGRQYHDYLAARKAGGERRYFRNKSHALYFLKCVAPTKLVDGAWLYGVLSRWNDARFASLIRIYLEELGEGLPTKNHVVLYRELLASNGCEQWDKLSDQHYVQGAIQLALAHHADEFLPEVIGFNLGYEQLPLHLLITAYELNELGIDPYYFTLHVTVDNADTGHAQKSLQGLMDACPRIGDRADFYRRVKAGYLLNMLGAGTTSVIASFDLEKELIGIFQRKSVVGKHLHSDYCRVAGRTVNDWLSDPARIPDFLAAMERAGWIKRNQDPQHSRFWNLIQGDRAEMFGVFTAYEQQIIADWIAGDMSAEPVPQTKPRQLTFKAKQRLLDTLGQKTPGRQRGTMARGVIRQHYARDGSDESGNEFNADLRRLEEQLASLSDKADTMALLTRLMSPASHHTAPGLMATRIFTQLLG
ncbi:MAG TPA: iron-containing redox enzyme family protein [Noviherbaspirillum sp.]|jgi:hypothetical protein|uniref:iron-containing redox enzyme family protein n=1 Tax=Noviherbaspirillum sp. TaxID=1926288 RepID=UPI002DDC91C6|nr:iron-containing redox enzyme family protein [Noviherbaspirillum sp.]HEV2610406.1 iron-containing redox enzyme family protein [Noviherbaspirillum sp.]